MAAVEEAHMESVFDHMVYSKLPGIQTSFRQYSDVTRGQNLKIKARRHG